MNTRAFSRVLRSWFALATAIGCVSCACGKPKAVGDIELDAASLTELNGVLDDMESAANTVKPALAEKHLLLDDKRFTAIEDFVPRPFGAETIRSIHDWARKNGKPGENIRFTERKYYRLTEDVIYATAIEVLNFDEPAKNRVTFVFLGKDGSWKIIHAHYSTMPKEG